MGPQARTLAHWPTISSATVLALEYFSLALVRPSLDLSSGKVVAGGSPSSDDMARALRAWALSSHQARGPI